MLILNQFNRAQKFPLFNLKIRNNEKKKLSAIKKVTATDVKTIFTFISLHIILVCYSCTLNTLLTYNHNNYSISIIITNYNHQPIAFSHHFHYSHFKNPARFSTKYFLSHTRLSVRKNISARYSESVQYLHTLFVFDRQCKSIN